MIVVQHRLQKHPVQAGAVAEPATGQLAACFSFVNNSVKGSTLARLSRVEFAVGSFQIGRQQTIQAADYDQAHIVSGIPVLADVLDLFQRHVRNG
ncbi:hypothetical protein D3C77_461840 [compost metagenome]